MTLTSACTPRVVLTGNSTRGPYSLVDASSVAIRLVSTGHLKLTRYSSTTDETGTVLALTTDYTVGGTQDARTFTLSSAQDVLTSSQRIVAERVQAYTQDLDLTTGGAFNATSLESRFDKLAEFQQELKAKVDRAIKADWRETDDLALPLPPTSGQAAIVRNSDGSFGHIDTDDILTLAGIADDISTLADISADITAVADIDAEVVAVSGSVDAIEAVSAALDGVTDLGNAVIAAEDAEAGAQAAETAARAAKVAVDVILSEAGYGAQIMLAGYDDGFAADFTELTNAQRTAIKTANVVVDTAPDDILSNNSNTPTQVFDSTGTRVWAPHNYFLNSASPATQSITVIVGETYTVDVVGAGNITVSNAGVGVATEGAPFTFTASTTTATCTKNSTLTTVQFNRGSTPTAYLETTGSERMGVPISQHPDTGDMCLLVEPNRTNYLLNSTVPATQTVSLAAATYTLWIEGAGSVALSGGPTGTATEGSPVTFVLSGTTSVTFTKTGTVSFFQCENGPNVTSAIRTFAAAVGRSLPLIALTLSDVPALGSEWLVYFDCIPSLANSSNFWYLNIHNGTGLANYLGLRSDGVLREVIASVEEINSTPGSVPVADTRFELTVRAKSGAVLVSTNGEPIGGGGSLDASIFVPTAVSLGQWNGTSPGGQIHIRRFAILPTPDIEPKDVSLWAHDPATGTRVYDIFLLAGQSNVYSGETIDGGIDVYGGRVMQLTQDGALDDADEPLHHPVELATGIGYGLPFARDYYIPGSSAPRRNVLLLPCAIGNTGFMDNRWNVGDDLYNMASSMVGYALAKYPNSVFRGILWMQGEREAAVPWTQANYGVAFDAMIAGFRSQFGEVPVIVGGMRPGWVAADATRQPVQDAIEDAPNRLYLCAYADPGTIGTVGGGVHYTAAEQRLFGEKWWNAWQTL